MLNVSYLQMRFDELCFSLIWPLWLTYMKNQSVKPFILLLPFAIFVGIDLIASASLCFPWKLTFVTFVIILFSMDAAIIYVSLIFFLKGVSSPVKSQTFTARTPGKNCRTPSRAKTPSRNPVTPGTSSSCKTPKMTPGKHLTGKTPNKKSAVTPGKQQDRCGFVLKYTILWIKNCFSVFNFPFIKKQRLLMCCQERECSAHWCEVQKCGSGHMFRTLISLSLIYDHHGPFCEWELTEKKRFWTVR